jgi:hypothetical protein
MFDFSGTGNTMISRLCKFYTQCISKYMDRLKNRLNQLIGTMSAQRNNEYINIKLLLFKYDLIFLVLKVLLILMWMDQHFCFIKYFAY